MADGKEGGLVKATRGCAAIAVLLIAGCSGGVVETPKKEATPVAQAPSAAQPSVGFKAGPSTLVHVGRDVRDRSRFLTQQTPHLQWHASDTPPECVLIVNWPTGDQLQIQLDVALCDDDRLWARKATLEAK